ncbi:hypothetical protein [Sinorhizobium meliloti]|nr:hypothetical protein [Sinorhizobium meliloti]
MALLSRSDRGKLREKATSRDLPLSRKRQNKATVLQLTFAQSLLRQHFRLPAFLLMSSPDALHLRFAAASQLRRPADTVAARPQDNNAFVCHQVSFASGILPARLCQFDAFPRSGRLLAEDHLQAPGQFRNRWL